MVRDFLAIGNLHFHGYILRASPNGRRVLSNRNLD